MLWCYCTSFPRVRQGRGGDAGLSGGGGALRGAGWQRDLLADFRAVRGELQLVLRPVAACGGKRGTEQCVKFCFAEIRKIASIPKLCVDFKP